MTKPRRGDYAHDVIWIKDTDILHETEKAIQVENARAEKVWLPRSQINFYADGTISVPRWLAEEKEIEG